ncbi:unnamed protein product [Meganyctiphanes norvegica]|uniref:Uncharacterized protein n=1 Tax=Meganyctiphanes norvegica TaxID=48144 RepID=A0AAV2RHI4_MEGNR
MLYVLKDASSNSLSLCVPDFVLLGLVARYDCVVVATPNPDVTGRLCGINDMFSDVTADNAVFITSGLEVDMCATEAIFLASSIIGDVNCFGSLDAFKLAIDDVAVVKEKVDGICVSSDLSIFSVLYGDTLRPGLGLVGDFSILEEVLILLLSVEIPESYLPNSV